MPKALSLEEYLNRTRGRSFNVILVVALLALYEAGMVLTDSPHRNAADVWLKDWLARLGDERAIVFHGALLVVFLAAAAVLLRRREPILRYLVPFLAETLLYAALLSPVVLLLQQPFLRLPGPDLLLDLGAGVYEEIVFRLLAIRGLLFALRLDPWQVFFEEGDALATRLWKVAGPLSAVVAASALMFASYHHVGPGGEPFALGVFVFRLFAGLLLAGLYFFRGLAAAAYTHAFYDILVHMAS